MECRPSDQSGIPKEEIIPHVLFLHFACEGLFQIGLFTVALEGAFDLCISVGSLTAYTSCISIEDGRWTVDGVWFLDSSSIGEGGWLGLVFSFDTIGKAYC